MIRRLKACLNGGRSRAEHPAVPVTAAELARDAAQAVAAGAEAVHLHPRGPDGAESLDAADIGAAVAAVRQRCPGLAVGVSTGLWITGGDVAARHAAVARWAGLPAGRRPAFASVNAGEDGFAALTGLLGAAGIAVEAGVWSPADAERVAGVPVDRILIEVLDAPAAGAVAAADAILGRLDRLGVTGPRLLHGEDDACWPLVAHAGRLGLPTRIGLEDTLVTDDGRPATDNAALVRRALRVWSAQRERR
ncbi:3-keto-5-aminohexanoate cleavage protein [Amorphoplanes nipponensis]|uniref:3-keto-5-aminohexanoate cleavage enzyme n=1 Tax=Actinoplanes nipponensis TaxID=135950 RepID=A0A919JG44_9ACTN|nr:3-keto-5-aminohexanoate cleavage protein [Actinoplanes nipponensis]GIE48571.1 3-keto-5-aminohexanoate cleavage enzyme [Actinoplanes nipponensis]